MRGADGKRGGRGKTGGGAAAVVDGGVRHGHAWTDAGRPRLRP